MKSYLAPLIQIVLLILGGCSSLDRTSSDSSAVFDIINVNPSWVSDLEAYVEDGGSLEVTNANGLTPLMVASLDGREDKVRALIDLGGNVHAYAESPWGNFAAHNVGEVDGVNLSEKGWTPIMWGVASGRSEVVDELLEHGAKPNEVVGGWSALTIAIRKNRELAERLISQSSEIETIGGKPTSNPVWMAIREEETDLLYEFLGKGGEITAAMAPDLGVLSAGSGNIEFLEVALKDIDDIDARLGNTSLLGEAAREGQNEVVEYLLDLGADPNGSSSLSGSALEIAARRCNTSAAEILIANDAHVDIRSSGGNTPLMIASDGGCSRFVEVLMEAGADPEIRNSDGERASDFARSVAIRIMVDENMRMAKQIFDGLSRVEPTRGQTVCTADNRWGYAEEVGESRMRILYKGRAKPQRGYYPMYYLFRDDISRFRFVGRQSEFWVDLSEWAICDVQGV